MIYLDNAATSMPLFFHDVNIHDIYCESNWFNPSSVSTKSRLVKKKMEESRCKFANYIKADANEIVFTSGGSESNNLAIQGWINANIDCTSLIVSEVEHPSVYEIAKYYERRNELHVYYCPVDNKGIYRLDVLEEILKERERYSDTPLVSMMYVNNETGVINDIKAVANIVHRYNGVLHTDAVQALTHISINIKELDVDLMSFSFCKIGMDRGLGALYVKNGITIDPIIHGGGQEYGLRSGTENSHAIISLGKVIDYYNQDKYDVWKNNCKDMAAYLMIQIAQSIPCEIRRNGDINNCIPNIISLSFDGISGQSLRDLLDVKDIIVSTGSACHSGSEEPSRVLTAMGINSVSAKETIRISFDHRTTITELTEFVDVLEKCVRGLQMLKD